MTKSLETLKRLHRTTIDTCKEQVAAWVAKGQHLEAQAQSLRDQAQMEALAAASDPLAASMIGAYTQQVRSRVATIMKERATVAGFENEARDALAAAFLEEKKVELLLEAAEARARVQEAAAEAAMMDEMAISRARRP